MALEVRETIATCKSCWDTTEAQIITQFQDNTIIETGKSLIQSIGFDMQQQFSSLGFTPQVQLTLLRNNQLVELMRNHHINFGENYSRAHHDTFVIHTAKTMLGTATVAVGLIEPTFSILNPLLIQYYTNALGKDIYITSRHFREREI
jgi:hypothetical protein